MVRLSLPAKRNVADVATVSDAGALAIRVSGGVESGRFDSGSSASRSMVHSYLAGVRSLLNPSESGIAGSAKLIGDA